MSLLTNNVNSVDNKYNIRCAVWLYLETHLTCLNQKIAPRTLTCNNVINTTETIYVEQTTRPYQIL